jgi:hypothetical protein
VQRGRRAGAPPAAVRSSRADPSAAEPESKCAARDLDRVY